MSLITKLTTLFSKKQSTNQLGVSIRQDAISFCYISDDKENQYQQIAIENGDYKKALRNLIAQYEVEGQVHIVLSDSFNQIVQVDKPEVPEEEINAALKWQVKDLVTFTPDDLVLDYYNSPVKAATGEKINVVCAQASVLKEIIELFDLDNLHIKSITTEEFAFTRLLPVQESPILLICQQPNEEVLITIVQNGEMHFHRRLRGFATIGKKTEEELSFGTIDSLSLEIQRSTDFYERSLKQPPIKDIQVLLPIKNEAFIARKLAENTSVPVNLFNYIASNSPNSSVDNPKNYATAIGVTSPKTEMLQPEEITPAQAEVVS